ncbi:MAG TPA: SDR family NAD(P)-dependent oxidoreductase, partial [Phycisphaerales bacterium]|nr:SDR family NAD(P)-dependent oxidoreductase [Phycisphaerales bacterium]
MAHDLSRRVAIITGASSGIGAAVARVLCAAGCRCVINARRADRLEAMAKDLNGARAGAAATVVGDASDAKTIDALFERARSTASTGGLGAPADLVVVN